MNILTKKHTAILVYEGGQKVVKIQDQGIDFHSQPVERDAEDEDDDTGDNHVIMALAREVAADNDALKRLAVANYDVGVEFTIFQKYLQ